VAELNVVTRAFCYNGMKLPDPDESLSVEGVRRFYSHRFPALVNATVEGPKISDGRVTYEFVHAIGTKG
jgi:PRTRC genetic system protein C